MDDQRSDVLAPGARLPEGQGPPTEGRADDRETARPDAGDIIAEPRHDGPTPPRRSRLRPILWLLLLAVAAVAAAVLIVPRLHHKASPGGRAVSGGPVPVGVAPAKQGDMPVTLSGLGTVTPLATVTVKTQINGYLIGVGFQEGQHVKKGDFLAQIDPRPYQVALEQAQAQLAKDQASLKDAELDLRRYNTLVAQNSIATQTRDTQAATVGQDRAQIMLDRAAIDTQKLNLTYTHIISPVTGRVGLRQVDPGNYVQTSDANGIVIVTQLQPISVIFTLPEDNLPEVLKQWHAGATLATTAYDRTGTREARSRQARHHRQRDRHHDRDGQAPRDLRQFRREPVPQSIRQHQAIGQHAAQYGADPDCGDPAWRARHLCLPGQAEQDRRGADDQARPGRRPSRSRSSPGCNPAARSSTTAPTG